MKDGMLVTGIQLLKMFDRSHPTRGITELSVELNQHKSRIHRLLTDLTKTGVVRKDKKNSRYSLGWGLFELTSEAAKATLLRLVAMDLLQKLLVAVPGRVQLCVLQSGTNVVIESLDGPYKFSLLEAVGTRRPAYFGASGKVLMAHTDAEIRVHLVPEKLVQFTENSISTRAEFDSELEPIRRQGFAISNEETVKWVRGIAVPVFTPNGTFLAAISLGLPVEELPDDRIQSIARRMNSVSAKITDALALNSS